MKRNSLALSGASILILATVALTAPAMAQSQAQDQSQSQQSQDQAPAKTMHHRHRATQTAKQEAKEDRTEDRTTAQLNKEQLAQAGNGSMSNASYMDNGNAGKAPTNTGYSSQPNGQSYQRPDDNPQTNNCVAAGAGVNCSSPTPNSKGSVSPGPSK
jgi:Ni/Co efflux regulator RcnB